MPVALPPTVPGLRVGLLGGSFDPPHAGHVHITRQALKGFGLDRVWWLVSPGNPLKREGPAPLARRLAAAQAVMQHPRVVVTAIEAGLGTRYTAETLDALHRLRPGVRFVWLMGADNLAGFHHWDRWAHILETTPVGVLARPGGQVQAGLSPAALRFRDARLPVAAARSLGDGPAPRWALLSGPLNAASSTAIRARGDWPRTDAQGLSLANRVL